LAIEKARTSALFRRSTKLFWDAVAAGGEGPRVLRLTGAIPIEGGVPLTVTRRAIWRYRQGLVLYSQSGYVECQTATRCCCPPSDRPRSRPAVEVPHGTTVRVPEANGR